MTYQAWREEFAIRLGREFPTDSVIMVRDKLARIVRDSNRIQTHAVNLCNRDVTPLEEKRAERARARIVAEFPKGTEFKFGGDPRGACAQVRLSGDSYDRFTAIPSREC